MKIGHLFFRLLNLDGKGPRRKEDFLDPFWHLLVKQGVETVFKTEGLEGFLRKQRLKAKTFLIYIPSYFKTGFSHLCRRGY